jgi:hypothetical protein
MILFCTSLIGCSSSKQIVKTEYIKQQVSELPKEPEYYEVKWQEKNGIYCVDKDNAKNLLKNRELDKGYQEEMREILKHQKEQK